MILTIFRNFFFWFSFWMAFLLALALALALGMARMGWVYPVEGFFVFPCSLFHLPRHENLELRQLYSLSNFFVLKPV